MPSGQSAQDGDALATNTRASMVLIDIFRAGPLLLPTCRMTAGRCNPLAEISRAAPRLEKEKTETCQLAQKSTGSPLRTSFLMASVRGSVTGRRIINELLPVFATENDSHLTGPVIVSLEGPFALHTITIKTKLGQFWPKDVS